jgi:AcrR family transcriptional regulator
MTPVSPSPRRRRVASAPATARVATSRAPWGTITRDQVIDTAITIVSAGGFEQMTIRGLAAELGVAPMSLYRHVRDKNDLLNEVVDRLLTTAWQPQASECDWRSWIAEAADKLRHFLVAQPAALHVYLSHPVVSPAATTRMQAMMRVLRDATGDEQQARQAYAAIHTYTIGFAALEASRAGWHSSEDATDTDTEALVRELAAYTTPHQFAEGLNYLLDGISSGTSKAR